MTDAHIEQLLLSEESTYDAYEKLFTESWRIRVTREQPSVTAETVKLNKLYLAMPLIGGVSFAKPRRTSCRRLRILNKCSARTTFIGRSKNGILAGDEEKASKSIVVH